jgi:hypothetical protein
MAISVFKYPQVLHCTLGSIEQNCDRGAHMIVSQHYTNSLVRLFRNTDQRVDVLLKDWDRRPIKLEEWEHVVFKLFDGEKEVLEKDCELIDWDRGHYVLSLTTGETGGLNLGDHSWCIIIRDVEAETTRMLYTNQDYGAVAPARVIEGPLPALAPVIDIALDDLSPLDSMFYSSALKGAAQMNNPAGIHSLVLNLGNYHGAVRIEASLDMEVPLDDAQWVAIETTPYYGTTGTEHLSFVGNYRWVRFVFSTIEGINSISYRN